GLSRRMGRDKARLRLGSRTMVAHIRSIAEASGVPARVIRKDEVKRCGPLGGIYTALRTSRADRILFLACDMPLITKEMIRWLLKALPARKAALFVRTKEGIGFPFALQKTTELLVARQIAKRELAVRQLPRVLRAKVLRLPRRFEPQL